MKLWFLFGGDAGDAGVVRGFVDGLEGRVCVLHPPFSDRAHLDVGRAESRAIGVDLVAMNGPEEERAFREAERFGDALAARLAPVDFMGVDLVRCLPDLLDVRAEKLLIVASAVEILRAEGFDHVVVWIRSFSWFYMAVLGEAATLGMCAPERALLRIRDGGLEPQPGMARRHAFRPVGETVIDRLRGDPVTPARITGAARPVPGGLTVMALTRARSYLDELAPVVAALERAGQPFRLLASDPATLDALSLRPGGTAGSAHPALLNGDAPAADACDPDRIKAALAALFAGLDALAQAPRPASRFLGDRTLDHVLDHVQNATIFRRAWLFCVQVERLAAWLDFDRTRRLFFYPSRTRLDPAPRDLMRARGGCAATAIFRSITADHRNFHLPHADALATLGLDQVAIARARGFPAGGVAAVGAPQADANFARWRDAAPTPGGARAILVATSGFDRGGELRWMAALARAARAAPGLRVVLKPHPSLPAGPYRAAIGEDDAAVRLEQGGDIHRLISEADAVLTDVSHVGKLAIYRGRALAVVNLSGAPFPYARFDEARLARLLDSEAAVAAFADAVRRGAPPPPDPEARAAFVAAEFTADDGLSGERMVAFLMRCGDPAGVAARREEQAVDQP